MWQFRSIRKCIACRNGIANHCPGGAASMIDEFQQVSRGESPLANL